MRFTFVALLVLLLFACKQESQTNSLKTESAVQNVEKTPENQEAGKVVRERELAQKERRAPDDGLESAVPAAPYNAQSTPLNYNEKYVGQYPSAVNFLGNIALRARMQQLMGSKVFSEVEKSWKQETPLEKQSGYLFTTAQSGAAREDAQLAVMIDIGRDVLFVAVKNFDTTEDQIYAERNADIPVRLKNWAAK
jgi:hypothetical protein